MATGLKLTVVGLDKLVENAKRAGDDYPKKLRQAMVASTTLVQNEAKRIVAYDKGNLRRRISKIVYSAVKGMIYTDVNYAPYIEEGTGEFAGHKRFRGKIPNVGWRWIKGMKAQPFMGPAFQTAVPLITKIYNDMNAKIMESFKK